MILDTLVDPIVGLFHAENIGIIWTVVIRTLCATIAGGLLGAERARKHHVAGLRTYVLVCLGSCVAMLTNIFLNEGRATGDGARLGAAVITGIGFLGAGSMIVTSRNQVKGLTTAAALWAVGTIGLAVGIGFYTLVLVATMVIMLVLIFMPKLEGSIQKNSRSFNIHIELHSRPDLKNLLDYLRNNHIAVLSIAYDPAYANTGLSVYSISLYANKNAEGKFIKYPELLKNLETLDYVNYVEFMD